MEASRHDTALERLRVLIPSNRDVYDLLSYGMVVDFENCVAELSDADIVSVPLPSRRARVAALREGRVLRRVDAPRSKYDICFFVAMEPQWIPSLRQVKRLRTIADQVVVYVFDSWLANLDDLHRHRHIWSDVDHVFVSFSHAVSAYRAAIECDVHYLPQAIDARWFHPYRSDRSINVISIGRRVPSVHQRLLEFSREEDLFYFFQTARIPQAIDLRENQELLGRLLQTAHVHVNWSVESTDPRRAEGGGPVTARWFESAACAGTVVGRPPGNPEFGRLFPYDAFVREIDPECSSDTRRVVSEALADKAGRDDRLALADHVRTCHTWKRRWQEIVQACLG